MRPGWSRLALRSLVRVSQCGATVRPRWPRLASSGVARSGETFNSVAFDCISLHSLSSTPWGFTRTLAWIPAFAGMTGQGAGMRGSRLRGNDGAPSRERRSARHNDAYNQCKGWRGDDAMGSCRGGARRCGPRLYSRRQGGVIAKLGSLSDLANHPKLPINPSLAFSPRLPVSKGGSPYLPAGALAMRSISSMSAGFTISASGTSSSRGGPAGGIAPPWRGCRWMRRTAYSRIVPAMPTLKTAVASPG